MIGILRLENMDKKTYIKLKECIAEIAPDIKVEFITEDVNLYNLGFVKNIPCSINIIASEKRIEELINICIQFEIDAFNTLDGEYPKESDEAYKKYIRYAWIYDILNGS